eukprot:m.208122 g.208122  ORF g.208122 m.208122 type:complete len:451 (+) comp18957_c1_seq5:103-1455(+)
MLSIVYLVTLLGIASSAKKPRHVLLTVVDDLGFDDLGFRNDNQIPTVNFNFIAQNGIILDNYYVQPSCSPTRATIMVGRKPVHTGINFWIPNIAIGLKLEETTFADVLNKRGYTSHAIGKWHLGFFKTPYTPTFRGFSSFYGYYEGSEDYFQHTTSGGLDFHDEIGQNCGPGCTKLAWSDQGTYSSNLFAARAVSIIEAHSADTPLFMYLAFQAVHAPSQTTPEYIAKYAQRINESDHKRQVFAGMIGAADEGFGNVTNALKFKGMFADTVFIVTTDNGGPTTECSTTGQSNFPFRGSKCSIWEGGTRGTGFLYWQGMPTSVQGTHYVGLTHAADWLPTVVAAIGSSFTPNETLPLDGVNLWDALMANTGVAPQNPPRTEIYYVSDCLVVRLAPTAVSVCANRLARCIHRVSTSKRGARPCATLPATSSSSAAAAARASGALSSCPTRAR